MNRPFPYGGPEIKNLPFKAGDLGSIPGWKTKIPLTKGGATEPTS